MKLQVILEQEDFRQSLLVDEGLWDILKGIRKNLSLSSLKEKLRGSSFYQKVRKYSRVLSAGAFVLLLAIGAYGLAKYVADVSDLEDIAQSLRVDVDSDEMFHVFHLLEETAHLAVAGE